MKSYVHLIVLFVLLGTSKVFSQTTRIPDQTIPINPVTVLKPYYLQIAYNKTTNIIFPTPVKTVDRGSADVLAQRADGVENVLRVKADREDFEQTNLSVITGDGKIYTFLLEYNKNPTNLTINLNLEGLNHAGGSVNFNGTNGQVGQNSYVVFEDVKVSDSQLNNITGAIAKKPRFIKKVGEEQNGILFALRGIYIKDNVIYYQLYVKNRTNINYDIDFIKFYIRDKKLVKRTATQDIEVPAIFESNPTQTITGKTELTKVFAMQKFTIPDDKDLVVELYEKNGGRHSKLIIPNDVIVQAREQKSL
ncbi:conjugative transposon TraN protein [Pedobacter sp. CG_S7]|uniref:conjugative transposon protein TraN n=1 Tax=Pedobacter sp. CG_S7 TaxID=3143930 RepID=UPI0033938CDD